MIKGNANSAGIPATGINGQTAYSWEHDCTNGGTFRCRENIYNNGEWFANGLVGDNFCPLIDTADYCGNTGNNGEGGGSSNGEGGPGNENGFLNFGLGNIFPKMPNVENFLKTALMLIVLAIAAVLLFKYMRKK